MIYPENSVQTGLLNYLGLRSEPREEIKEDYSVPNANPISSSLGHFSINLPSSPLNVYNIPNRPINYQRAQPQSALTQSKELIKKYEGYRDNAYWDVNAYRVGYGSDTVTTRDGRVRKVNKGERITKEEAELDLERRTQQFMKSAANSIGNDIFNRLPASAQASLTSLAYNYGSLDKLPNVIRAARSGNLMQLSHAIESLGSHNKGINRSRRRDEARYLLNNR